MSIAIAVFPVCLSPMINSLCPLPIGIIESIAKIPVWSGVSTDFLIITLGAKNSTSLYLSTLYGSFPSSTSPNGFTTLPIISSLTPILTGFPVLLAIVPSLTSFSPPNKTHPTLSSSRFIAIP